MASPEVQPLMLDSREPVELQGSTVCVSAELVRIPDPDVFRAGTNQQQLPGNSRQHKQLRAFPRIKRSDGNDGKKVAADGEATQKNRTASNNHQRTTIAEEATVTTGSTGAVQEKFYPAGRQGSHQTTSTRSRQGPRMHCAHTLATLWGERGLFRCVARAAWVKGGGGE
ncbi:hypothetical protein NDU88_005003 [Pleurodeles waltl]|uniref:Uncharacterized protein n=1 Tax=Pleurodeles waltl TaxID=8319 RepID=A0AAV7RH96_PLEWA|nr:hypothetical protein NDU88_005003 [Pleurodeles waltl]